MFTNLVFHVADRGKTKHWEAFYSERSGALDPSPFAVYVRELLNNYITARQSPTLLEVGCGNGRDSVYFARSGMKVTAIDTSEAAIAYCRHEHDAEIRFLIGSLKSVGVKTQTVDVIYSRFVLHAMTTDEEGEFLDTAANCLKLNGLLFVECRSINDPLARKGEVLSPTERIDGHYRRFIIARDLCERVRAVGLIVEKLCESNGLAVFGDEDPVVIRLIARKP
jgi:cyclopropane fatty-acyl-phospholipid synthase-like methyltransferase